MTDLLPRDDTAWESVDDGVMGGRSRSAMRVEHGVLRFVGTVSLANDGGFASVRARLRSGLGDSSALALRVRGDGRRYQLRLRPDADPGSVAYRCVFASPEDWMTLILPFTGFEAVFRGRHVDDAGPMRARDMRLIGFMTAGKTPGPFHLEIAGCQLVDAAP